MSVKVSVIIPTYKRSEDIARAVDSVLAQTIDSFEVIVVDDNGVGTPDGDKTAAVMEKYKDNPCVKYLRHETNKNGSAARNTGILASCGEYISFLDDDDTYRPERLQAMYEKMESMNESWGACYTGYVKHMANGKKQYSAEKNEGDLFVQALMRALYIGSGSNLFFRRSVVEEIGLFDVSFRRNQDLEYLVRVLKKYKMAYVDEVLMDIYYDVRTVHLTREQSIEREKLFRERFAPYLVGLSEKEIREILVMYAIDNMRSAVSGKRYGEAVGIMLRERVPVKTLIQYAGYVYDRKKNNSCYGFVVKL